MKQVWNKDYRIRIYEVSDSGRVHLPVVFDLMQDIASEHANHLGVGFDALRCRNLSWFLTRLHVSFCGFPCYGDILNLKTWPRLKKKIFAYRDFEIRCEDRILGAASSIWCLVDLENRKVLKPHKELPDLPQVNKQAVETSFPSISTAEDPSGKECFKAGITDMDLNGHVNNSAYVRWAIETLDPLDISDRIPVRIDAVFKEETSPGEDLLSTAAMKKNGIDITTIHRITKRSSGRDCFRMKIEWVTNP